MRRTTAAARVAASVPLPTVCTWIGIRWSSAPPQEQSWLRRRHRSAFPAPSTPISAPPPPPPPRPPSRTEPPRPPLARPWHPPPRSSPPVRSRSTPRMRRTGPSASTSGSRTPVWDSRHPPGTSGSPRTASPWRCHRTAGSCGSWGCTWTVQTERAGRARRSASAGQVGRTVLTEGTVLRSRSSCRRRRTTCARACPVWSSRISAKPPTSSTGSRRRPRRAGTRVTGSDCSGPGTWGSSSTRWTANRCSHCCGSRTPGWSSAATVAGRRTRPRSTSHHSPRSSPSHAARSHGSTTSSSRRP